MDKKFWLSINENNFAVPEGHSVLSLTEELISYIGSTDPELRDTIGLEAFYSWLSQGRYRATDLRSFITRLSANLQKGIGETESDSVFLRSFSALWLANILSYDNEIHVLEQDDIPPILEAALTYFAAERDIRGYVPDKGWAHGIAHGADLLGALVKSTYTSAADHLRILDCIAGNLRNATLGVYLYNEDSRIAQPVIGIFVRGTLNLDQIKNWLASVSIDWNGAWRNEAGTRAYHNGRDFVRSVYWYLLMMKGKDVPDRERIKKLLQDTLEQARPWD